MGGATGSTCFSPTQNLSMAYQAGAKGCACNSANDASVCVQGVALICESNLWLAVEDGPCMPVFGTGGASNVGTGGTSAGGSTTTASACFSPTQHLEMIKPMASGGCPCNPATDASVCIQGTGLICSNNYWMAVWDGPCMPSTGGAGNTGGTGVGGKSTGGAATGGKATGGSTTTGVTTSGKACGARAGNTCTANEYCAYQPTQICGQGDAEALCQPRPQVCDTLYAPVCGCDRKTYGNSCEAAASGTGVYDNGACTN